MRLYLVRHGETDWNIEMRIQGQTDVSLNPNGIMQAKSCADYFKNYKFNKVYTSNLRRAIQTAEIITNNAYELVKLPEFNERHFGIWQTQLWEDIHKNIPNLKEIWKNDDGNYKPEKGESLRDLVVRVQSTFKKIIQSSNYGDEILIVSHGGPLKAMLGYVKGADIQDIPDIAKQDNCCINIVNYHNSFQLELLNYVHKK